MRLENKVAIVTGATSGIGLAIAKKYAEEGAKVVYCGRREDRGLEIQKDMESNGFDTHFVQADVSKEEDLERLFKETKEKYGRVDILVNNAGILRNFKIKDMDIEKDLDEVYDINLRSYFIGTKLAFNYMEKGGSIVNIASIGGLGGSENLSTYGATKAAVISLTKTAAKEGGRMGIRSNAICPGTIYTEMMDPDDEFTKMTIGMIPLNRAGEPKEVAALATFLASDDAGFINGAQVTIDGGLIA